MTLPGDVAVGDYYEVGIELEITSSVQLRSTDLELRVFDPDRVRGEVRACQEAPNNTSPNEAHTLPPRSGTCRSGPHRESARQTTTVRSQWPW